MLELRLKETAVGAKESLESDSSGCIDFSAAERTVRFFPRH